MKACKLKWVPPQNAYFENTGPHFAHPAHSLRPLLIISKILHQTYLNDCTIHGSWLWRPSICGGCWAGEHFPLPLIRLWPSLHFALQQDELMHFQSTFNQSVFFIVIFLYFLCAMKYRWIAFTTIKFCFHCETAELSNERCRLGFFAT